MENSYCAAVAALQPGDVNRDYHDNLYGFPLDDDDELFGRLILEINQAGLSWTTILKKADAIRRAYDNFSIDAVRSYGIDDFSRLLSDPSIIRNRLKISAAIHNAGVIHRLRQEYGSFKAWLDHHHPLEKPEWVKLFKQTFKFTGGEITGEFLMSTGYLPGAHSRDCPVYQRIAGLRPPFLEG